ncbi:class I SAM-dependent methyltransferase [Paenibacillus sp. TRM 82003]|uniref:class I SAM-dependent methyltransferase n=1 Tax=Kineococcus sp. TRM81007 TaxID=2925831 RepID=UPI001F5AFE8A|nr:class I SAM-dependent methyltransferase [Kineococcus sp. TRM81007]MCI2238769.1 class I SAM-dependent methyltransferase [Kineococcus sp. TRM81007]MCI3924175.1 class I SAM-dependent methyltransferase [Paenibacillus sp. TRM 82003]
MDPADVAALTSPAGRALLDVLAAAGPADPLALGQRLRREGHEPALVALAMTQARLRERAAAKLGPRAAGLLLTAAGVEQATRAVVAAEHARRFTTTGVRRVADLGCGIGADALAFTDAGLDVLAVDADPGTAAAAAANLAGRGEVRCADVTAGVVDELGPGDGAWFDPARRTAGGRRLLDPEATSPPLSFVLATAARVPATGAKLAPGLPHELVPAGAEAQWTSVDGDVVEAALWCGPLARPGVRRSALVVRGGERSELDDADNPVPAVGAVGTHLHEPDGAVVRAGLVGAAARLLGGRLVDETIAYVTTDGPAASPFARSYAVLDVLPFGLKPLRRYLRERDVGPLTVKKRGTAVDPDVLRRQLALKGSTPATVVLTRVAGRQSVLVVEPVG